MTDYGHDLLFGAFVTPTARPALQAAELAVHADRAGLDLVTFQDHPYANRFHDTWTLISYAAARTDRIRLSGNVLNLPLRDPAILARSHATLDRLTGGRIDLALGAGGFWDAIESMGGGRLTAGQSIDALEEAVTLIRAMWGKAPVDFDGKYYQLSGVAPGPAPAHDMPIWIGAYKPRISRMAGRVADGVLPSLGYLPDGPASYAEINKHVDEGAAAAGRDPGAIRRLLNIGGTFAPTATGRLNGPPDRWASDLAELNLEYGVSAFILATDDRTTMDRYAAEVAPAVRELVAPRCSPR
jgi:alkanesulfonate monooxygenase SsuD/methylene tetrahydromethanopterin reductase-like flavin-dependent oxidoreductase (luciferase family)